MRLFAVSGPCESGYRIVACSHGCGLHMPVHDMTAHETACAHRRDSGCFTLSAPLFSDDWADAITSTHTWFWSSTCFAPALLNEDHAFRALLLTIVTELPVGVLVLVLMHLPGVEVARLACVHKSFKLALDVLRTDKHTGFLKPSAQDFDSVSGFSRFVRSSWLGDEAVVARFIGDGGVNEDGQELNEALEAPNNEPSAFCAIYFAVRAGRARVLQLLLDAYDATDDVKILMETSVTHGHVNTLLVLKDIGEEHLKHADVIKAACAAGHVQVLAFLFQHGVTINCDSVSVMIAAAANGRVDAIKYLLDEAVYHSDWNERRYVPNHRVLERGEYSSSHAARVACGYALLEASLIGHLDTMHLLFERGVDVHFNNDKALINAATKGHLQAVELLISKNADIHVFSGKPLTESCFYGHTDIVRLLIKNGADVRANDDDAFMFAVMGRNMDIMQLLVEHGTDPNVNDGEALNYASDAETANFFIERGYLGSMDDALLRACKHNNLEIVQLLLPLGATHPSALVAACKRKDSLGLVRYLLHHRVRNNIDTALLEACKNGILDMARSLVHHGAKPNEDCLRAASARKDDKGLVVFLQASGARRVSKRARKD